jgi:ATP-dependent exoDNAse (exonuclease V) beta subunit
MTILEIHPILSQRNSDNRDDDIIFYENNHKYVILSDSESMYTSVTTWVHSHFPHFNADEVINSMINGKGWKEGHKYWGQTPQQIKASWTNNKSAAEAGTNLHLNIECFMNDKRIKCHYTNKELYEIYTSDYNEEKQLTKSLEWQYFINFIRDNPSLKPFRTEWTVYDEDVKIAGSIDMVFENPNGTLSIYDWKRAKNITRVNNFNKFGLNPIVCHLPDANFWHYALQLNTYKTILERKYGRTVDGLYLVRLHPEAEEKTYELIVLPDLKREMCELWEERKNKLEL